MPGRSWNAQSAYRYGFNGKENDNEVKGVGDQQDYGMRIYDPRVGRFLSVEPITRKYPELTPYQFASNTPLQAIDLDSKEAKYIAVNIFQLYDSKGALQKTTVVRTEIPVENASLRIHGLSLSSYGPLGPGTLYGIARSKTVKEDDGSEKTTITEEGNIYVSPPPKSTGENEYRPVSRLPIQVMIFGSGENMYDNTGNAPNPNVPVHSFNYAEWSDFFEFVLAGVGPENTPGPLETPELLHIMESGSDADVWIRVDKLEKKWKDDEDKTPRYAPNMTLCPICKEPMDPRHPHVDGTGALLTNGTGKPIDTIKYDAKTNKTDTIPVGINQ